MHMRQMPPGSHGNASLGGGGSLGRADRRDDSANCIGRTSVEEFSRFVIGYAGISRAAREVRAGKSGRS